MKKGILFITSFIIVFNATAQYFGGSGNGNSVNSTSALNLGVNNTAYTGGSNDGASAINASSVSLSATLPIYSGGNDDGTGTASASAISLGATSRFAGGSDDGHGITSSTGVSLAASSRFAGGADDGFQSASASSLTLGVSVSGFAGGADDGSGAVLLSSANLGITSRYAGGADDGIGTVSVSALSVVPAVSMFAGGSNDGISSITSVGANLGVAGMYAGGQDDGFSIVNAFSLFIALPVVWVDFTVTKYGDDAQLKWVVSNERNDDGFMVERSYDGIHFADIAFIKATNAFGATNTYRYTDIRPAASCPSGQCTEVYYRLRQIDLNQKFDYSVVRKLNLNLNSKMPVVLVYPNPASGVFFIHISNMQSRSISYSMELYNSTGALIIQKQADAQQLAVDVSSLAGGIYYVKININDHIYSYPISITH